MLHLNFTNILDVHVFSFCLPPEPCNIVNPSQPLLPPSPLKISLLPIGQRNNIVLICFHENLSFLLVIERFGYYFYTMDAI